MIVISVEEERAKQAGNIHRAHRCAAKQVRRHMDKEVKIILKGPLLHGVPKSHRCTILSVDAAGVTFSPGFGEEVSAQSFNNINQFEFS